MSVGPLKVQTICLESANICVSFHFYGYWLDAGGKLGLWCVLAPIRPLCWGVASLGRQMKGKETSGRGEEEWVKKPTGQGFMRSKRLESICLRLFVVEGVCVDIIINAKPRLFDHLDLVTHMISWLWPHKWHLIISTAEKSQDRIKFTLDRRNVLLKHWT